RIELERDARQAEIVPQSLAEQDDLAIRIGTAEAERLRAYLVELAVASLLRPLVAEHRPHVPEPLGAVVEQVVLDRRPDHARRAFGAQRQGLAVERIDEGVHLLLDDVGHFADATHEKARRLDDGRADLLVAVGRHGAGHGLLEPSPPMGLGGQDIVHAPDGPDFLDLGHCLVGPGRAVAPLPDRLTNPGSRRRPRYARRNSRRWPGTPWRCGRPCAAPRAS